MIRLRKETPELGWGRGEVLASGNKAVLAFRSSWRDSTLVTVHNFSSHPCSIALRISDAAEAGLKVIDAFSDAVISPDDQGRYELTLDAHGYRWLRVGTHDSAERRKNEPET